MIRFLILFVSFLLDFSQAAAAAKPCAALQAEIEAKLAAHGVKNYELAIAEKGAAAAGKVVGFCEGGAKQIMYLKKTNAAAPAQRQTTPEPPAAVLPPLPQVLAPSAPIPPAPSAAPEPLTDDAPVVEVRMIDAPSSKDVKPCAELQAEIAAKLAAKGVKAYELVVSVRTAPVAGRIVGICENGSKKITYSKK